MKKFLLILILLGIISIPAIVNAQQVIVSDDASYTTPASGAMLDVNSTSKGFMPPRISLTSLTDVATITAPTTGLMVYNTGAGALSDKGLYFWNGTIWEKALSGGVNGANNMAIADDGTVTLNGDATTFNDLVINPSIARNNGGTAPNWAVFVQTNIFTWMFADGSNQEVTFTVQMPHDYKEGSDIFPHIHWAPMSAAGTTRVNWVIDFQWMNLGSTFSATSTPSLNQYLLYNESGAPSVSLGALQSTITPLGTISGSGKTVSSIIVCRIYRNGSNTTIDTYSGIAALLSIDFHYEIDAFGSRTEYAK